MARKADDYFVERLLNLATLRRQQVARFRRQQRSSCHDKAILSLLDRWAAVHDVDFVDKLLAAMATLPPLAIQLILVFLPGPPLNNKFAAQQGPRWDESDTLGMHYCLFIPRDNTGVCKFPGVCETPEDNRLSHLRRIPPRLFTCYPHDTLLVVSWKYLGGASCVELWTSTSKTKRDEYYNRENIDELMRQLFPRNRYYWLPCLADVCRWVWVRPVEAFEDTRKGYLTYLCQFLRSHIQPIWHALFDRHEQLHDAEVLRTLILGDFYDEDVPEYESYIQDEEFSFVLSSCSRTLAKCEDLEEDRLAWLHFVRQNLFKELFEAFQVEIAKCGDTNEIAEISCAESSEYEDSDECE
eukprot:GILK01014991.1.p1 GENE.GILK01014991.1~~GILK01014991.1.p1  ORF type:complete len:354 (-),score=34.71 GILK01014991.1:74-1135(-)